MQDISSVANKIINEFLIATGKNNNSIDIDDYIKIRKLAAEEIRDGFCESQIATHELKAESLPVQMKQTSEDKNPFLEESEATSKAKNHVTPIKPTQTISSDLSQKDDDKDDEEEGRNMMALLRKISG